MKQTKYKDAEIGRIPERRNKAVFSSSVNVNPKRSIKKGLICKFVSMDELKEHNKQIQGFTNREFKGGSKFVNGDTLMSRITPCLENGKGAFVDILNEDEVGAGSTEFIVLSGKEGVTINEFVYYLSISPKVREVAIQSMVGTSGRQRVQNDIFDRLEIEFPQIDEQKAIAKILSDFDVKIELNQQMNKTLEAIGQALFKHWFVDFEFPDERGRPYKSSGGKMVESELGEIPKGWRLSTIGNEFQTILGGTPSTRKKEYWTNGTIPWINSGKVNEFRITSPSEYITKEALENSATKMMPQGTTVLAITGATLGQVSRLEINACGNQSIIGILPNEHVPSEYIYYWVRRNINRLIAHQTGGAQQHINKNNVNSMFFLVPSKEIVMPHV